MARWKLAAPHYLNVNLPDEKIEWEYEERDLHKQGRGSLRRIRYPVPLLMDPKNPGEWNDANLEGIVVTDKMTRSFPKDIMFLGDPTPDMIPLDEEAERISESFQHKWTHPIESLPGEYGQSIMQDLEGMIRRAVSESGFSSPDDAKRAAVAQNRSFKDAEFEVLKGQMADLMDEVRRLRSAQGPTAPLPQIEEIDEGLEPPPPTPDEVENARRSVR